MAEDSRKPSSANSGEPFDPQKGEEKTGHWRPRVLVHRPGEDSEAYEKAKQEASLLDAAKIIKKEDWTKVHKQPCVRDALLPGIGGGTALGAIRFIIGGSVITAGNWAVGSFAGVSTIMYFICQRRRQKDKEGIQRVVQVIDQKEAMKSVTKRVQEVEAQTKGKQASPSQSSTPKASSADTQQKPNFWSTFKFW